MITENCEWKIRVFQVHRSSEIQVSIPYTDMFLSELQINQARSRFSLEHISMSMNPQYDSEQSPDCFIWISSIIMNFV